MLSVLQKFLKDYPASSYLIAFSGGLDSHVLLHSLVRLRASLPELQLRAIHINHGLQADAAVWAAHCCAVCADLKVPLRTVALQLKPKPGQSTEALAREARYQAVAEHLARDEMLLTAHHQNDQAETLLLNLLRGAGAAGLAAMPLSRSFYHSRLGRPLLHRSRQQLEDYASAHELQWIEDPSNQSTAFDRNYLRHEIIPRLQQRWSAASDALCRAAQWQAENQELLAELLQQRLAEVAGSQGGTLSVAGLLTCTPVMQKALLRQWLRAAGFSMPSARKLEHVCHDVLLAKADAKPCVRWADCEIRRYRGDIYALSPLSAHDASRVYAWEEAGKPLYIPELAITLQPEWLNPVADYLRQAKGDTVLQVRFRRGGEKLRMPSGQHVSLKKFMQDKGIPSWQRDRVPLVYAGGELLLIPGYFQLQAKLPIEVTKKNGLTR